MAEVCDSNCPAICPGPFERLIIYPTIRNGSRIEWTMAAGFFDPGPYVYRLEVGRTGLPDADDWEQVGLPVQDAPYLEDTEDRVFGSYQWTHYRVRLTTPVGNYYSRPTNCLGRMDRRDWGRTQDMFRRAQLSMDQMLTADSGMKGWLLKRRIYGEPCQICSDPLTRNTTDPQCPTCYGTGFVGGYFEPLSCSWASINPVNITSEQARSAHMTFDYVAQGQMIADPILHPRDVWISSENDYRWGIDSLVPAIEVRGVPVLYNVIMGRLPFSDIIYHFPIPDHPPGS